jgi:2-dehydropantoate 2-reductase
MTIAVRNAVYVSHCMDSIRVATYRACERHPSWRSWGARLKICVLGAGALGCAIGAALAEGGCDVWLLNRAQTHVDAMKASGLVVVTAGGERRVQVQAATHAEGVGPVDLVIVLVKSFQTREAIAGAKALIGERTVVLSLQNGLGHEDILAAAVGRERVLSGKTYVGGVLLGPGRIISGTAGKHTYIGELDGTVSERAKRIAALFNDAGLATTVSDNIVGTMWDKLLVNVATGALSGITRLSYGELYAVPEVKATALAAVAEALAVARAAGIRLSITEPVQAWERAAEGLPADFKASMLQSLEKGSVTEVDFINGAVVRWGQRVGVPTPVNAALVGCIKGIERSLRADRTVKEAA